MQEKETAGQKPTKEASDKKPLSDTIENAHGSGDGSIGMSEDGLLEPDDQTIADKEAATATDKETEEY